MWNVCFVCEISFDTMRELIDHVHSLHPDFMPEYWPDGEIVHYDELDRWDE
jgi:hypothetical protein